jgi:hypothetical protein
LRWSILLNSLLFCEFFLWWLFSSQKMYFNIIILTWINLASLLNG